jgi:adhesin transport system membrane fusion protein
MSVIAFSTTALKRVASPRRGRMIVWMLTLGFCGTVAALVLTPWQQNVAGSGQVVSFDPVERRQAIEAPIGGRLTSWDVVEGSRVRRGDLIAEITDNDPALLDRIGQERDAASASLKASLRKADSSEQVIVRLETARERAVDAARARIAVADQKILSAEQALAAAEAALATAKLNFERLQQLSGKGLASRRNMELATLDLNKNRASVDSARASLEAERSSRFAVDADFGRIGAEAWAKVEDARAKFSAGVSDAEKARGDLVKVDVRLARQQSQTVVAPIDGTVIRVFARQGAEMVKEGDVLAELVPDSLRIVVELYVDGNDVPLISRGRRVRLQFEGWPALQFVGWPSVAVGTFGGRVLLVDAADDGQGRFRILVEPDPNDEPWPAVRYLRQGVQVNGWVLLDQVSIGYELWRQFNGFPPTVLEPVGTAGSGSKK